MELSYFLAQLLGTFMLIKGVAVWLKRNELRSLMSEFANNTPAMWIMSAYGTLIGLILVLVHNVWDAGLAALIITILGWGIFLGSVFLFLASKDKIKKCFDRFNNPKMINISIVLNLVLGIYLMSVGFGM